MAKIQLDDARFGMEAAPKADLFMKKQVGKYVKGGYR